MAWYWWLLSAWGIFWILSFAFINIEFYLKLIEKTVEPIWVLSDLLLGVSDKLEQFYNFINNFINNFSNRLSDIVFAIDNIDLKISKKIGFRILIPICFIIFYIIVLPFGALPLLSFLSFIDLILSFFDIEVLFLKAVTFNLPLFWLILPYIIYLSAQLLLLLAGIFVKLFGFFIIYFMYPPAFIFHCLKVIAYIVHQILRLIYILPFKWTKKLVKKALRFKNWLKNLLDLS